MRVTQKHVEAKVAIVNGMLGFDVDALEYNTVGSIQLYAGSGAYAVHRVVNEAHAVDNLTGMVSLREAAAFLSGMIAALQGSTRSRWAQHYASASRWLTEAMEAPSGPRWVAAHHYAVLASDAAGTDMERELAQSLARDVREAAAESGIPSRFLLRFGGLAR